MYHMQQNNSRQMGVTMPMLAILAGLGGELHVHIPALGTIPMLDVVSYCISVPIIMLNWSKMGKSMRRSLMWSFAWMCAAMIANLMNYEVFGYWLKCVVVVSSSWAIIAVAYLLFRSDARLYLWYLVGAGLGGWISLYHFRNGAIEAFIANNDLYAFGSHSSVAGLIDKQVYPNIAKGIVLGFALPFFICLRRAPVFILLCLMLGAAFWLLFHGGSRSSFGIFGGAAALGFVVVYGKGMAQRITKSPIQVLILLLVALGVIFGAYKFMAQHNLLGDNEREKYELEFGAEGRGAIEGRAGFGYAVEEAIDSAGIGLGHHLRHHSVISNALACEGIIGFLFWIYFYWQCFWFVCHRLPYSGKYSAFIFLMILSAGWDVFGSPFGLRHKFFCIMAFIAICRDHLDYGYNTVFMAMPNRSWLPRRY